MRTKPAIMTPNEGIQTKAQKSFQRIIARPARYLLPVCLLAAEISFASAQGQTPISAYEQASQAFEQGQLPKAEQTLRGVLEEHPHDAHALGMLGVVLDAEKRYPEAEKCYDLALRLEPHATVVLNNLGNHYLVQGELQAARAAYLRVVGLDSHHENANLHLAEMSVEARDGNSALHYLDQLPGDAKAQPAAELLRARALHLVGNNTAAQDLLEQIEKRAHGDPRIAFSVGMIYGEWRFYDKAEQALSRARELMPANFDILYNLSLAAGKAGHLDRAQEALEAALREKPDDVDCLLGLSHVYIERQHLDQAVRLLAEAQRLAPERPDVLLSMAHAEEKLGSYGDTAEAYEKYLRLRPNDDVVRRERGFALARAGKVAEAIPNLQSYVEKHPKDPIGFYEMAVAETVDDSAKAAEHLNQALALDPNLVPARYARAVLNYQDGKPAEAENDLQLIVTRDPSNYRALDVLGEVNLELNQLAQAEACLRRAANLAPADPQVKIHYAQVLQEVGREEEAAKILGSLKQLGLSATRPWPRNGELQDVLGLPATPPAAQYLPGLHSKLERDPNDLNANLDLGKTLLAQGKTAEALTVYRKVRGLTSDPKVYAKCGKALLDSEQYGLAREFLHDAVAGDPSSTDLRLDLVVALFHSAGPAVALAEIDGMLPVSRRYEGDYYLLRAQVLDGMGRTKEAVDDLNRGFRASPTRSDLYFQATLFLIKHELYQQALDLVKEAGRVVPYSPQILLAEAIVYEVSQRSDQAEQILAQIQTYWPEWSPPYLLRGVILESHFKSVKARSQLETALALGGDDATAYYYLALAHTHTSPQNIHAAEKAVQQALRMDPNNAHALSLAGKIALMHKQYAVALDYLTSAIRLEPDFVDAHEALSALYRALGEKAKSIAELKQVLAIKQKKAGTSQSPATISNLLFAVRPPLEDHSGEAP
jgi:tetratricopeptide (TPR) repeat protein